MNRSHKSIAGYIVCIVIAASVILAGFQSPLFPQPPPPIRDGSARNRFPPVSDRRDAGRRVRHLVDLVDHQLGDHQIGERDEPTAYRPARRPPLLGRSPRRSSSVGIVKLNSLSCQFIDVWCFIEGVSVYRQISSSQIVGHD